MQTNKPLAIEDLKARTALAQENEERVFKAAESLMRLVAELGLDSIEVLGIKVKNSPNARPRVSAGQGFVDIPDEQPLKDAYDDPMLYAATEGFPTEGAQ